ncbi:MAG: histidine phosphatase family protein [Saprospiraceae bacterium]
MKTIIIIRHAKSAWNDIRISDFDRTLDARGWRDAPLMALRLKDAGHYPQMIISSSAVRAKTTAQFFADAYGLEVHETKDLYHGDPQDYLDKINVLDENIKCIALFGHNPGITYLANEIQMGCTDNIPTCGIIVATMPDLPWSKADWSQMNLETLMFPKYYTHD